MNQLAAFRSDRLRLQAEMLLWRTGWLPVAAVAFLLLAVVMLMFVVPVQQARISEFEAQLATLATNANGRVARAPEEPALRVLQRTLMPQSQTNETLRQINRVARESGLNSVQADFRRINDNAGVASQFQIALPLRGDYLALRRFALGLLTAVPSLSIDQITVKRELVSTNQVEAQVILSIWQLPEYKVLSAGEQQ